MSFPSRPKGLANGTGRYGVVFFFNIYPSIPKPSAQLHLGWEAFLLLGGGPGAKS